MNFKICYGFQNVSNALVFDSNILVFFQIICYDLKSKIVSWYKRVICYRIELILYFEPWQLDAVEATRLKAITNFKIHQNFCKYWFTFWHFALDDPAGTLFKKQVIDFNRKKSKKVRVKTGFICSKNLKRCTNFYDFTN